MYPGCRAGRQAILGGPSPSRPRLPRPGVRARRPTPTPGRAGTKSGSSRMPRRFRNGCPDVRQPAPARRQAQPTGRTVSARPGIGESWSRARLEVPRIATEPEVCLRGVEATLGVSTRARLTVQPGRNGAVGSSPRPRRRPRRPGPSPEVEQRLGPWPEQTAAVRTGTPRRCAIANPSRAAASDAADPADPVEQRGEVGVAECDALHAAETAPRSRGPGGYVAIPRSTSPATASDQPSTPRGGASSRCVGRRAGPSDGLGREVACPRAGAPDNRRPGGLGRAPWYGAVGGWIGMRRSASVDGRLPRPGG